MPHARTTIRDAIVTTLTGLTTTGANVFPSRFYRLDRNELPGITVSFESEEIEYSNVLGVTHDRDQERVLSVTIAAYEDGNIDTAEDTIDQICLEVEEAMAADKTLGDTVLNLSMDSTNFVVHTESETPVVKAVIRYGILYHVKERNPDVII